MTDLEARVERLEEEVGIGYSDLVLEAFDGVNSAYFELNEQLRINQLPEKEDRWVKVEGDRVTDGTTLWNSRRVSLVPRSEAL